MINYAVGMIIGNARYGNLYTTEHGKEMHELLLKHGKNAVCVLRWVLSDIVFAENCHA